MLGLGFDPKRSRPYERGADAWSDFKKVFKDVGSDITSQGKLLGFYSKVAENKAKLEATKALLEGARTKLKHRVGALNTLIEGVGSNESHMGIRGVLQEDKFKYETNDTLKVKEDIEKQLKAVEGLTRGDGTELTKDPEKEKFNDVSQQQKEVVKKLENTYKKNNPSAKPKRLREMLESIVTDKNPKRAKEDKKAELENEIDQKSKDARKAVTLKHDYDDKTNKLEKATNDASDLVEKLRNRSKEISDTFEQKINTAEKSLKTRNQDLQKIVQEFEDVNDALVGSERLFKTQANKEVRNYKKCTETLIDRFIDFHRFVEKHKQEQVANDIIKSTILFIRRENRTYFHKELIDSKQKLESGLAKEAENAARVLMKTSELDNNERSTNRSTRKGSRR